VEAARHYKAVGHQTLPKILACDVARFGDDQSVFGIRQGRKYQQLEKFRGKPTDFIGERVIHWIRTLAPDATVVDGDGLGAGVCDHCTARGFRVFEFHGGAASHDPAAYFNRRTEVWAALKGWLISGAEIPDDAELAADLTGPQFDYAQGKRSHGTLALEHKDLMKKRGLNSPDCGDTLAMTFGVQVAPKEPEEEPQVLTIPGPGDWMGSSGCATSYGRK